MPDINNCNGNSVYLPSLASCDECEALRNELDVVEGELNNKVDKEPGKGLSTNDYTDADKNKLTNIEAGAERNRTYTAFTGKPTGNQTPGFGSTFVLQQIKQSTTGQVSGTDRTVRIPNTVATTTTPGLMSAADKTNLENLIAGGTGGGQCLEEITYAALKAKRDGGTLDPGRQYRITNYVCTTTQEESRAVSHPFDIIVTADNESTLNENARACLHDGDNYYSAQYCQANLEAWELKYCIDNDADRFGWADTTNGKGVIYYMKDDHGNECPYDFKQIQFARYEVLSSEDSRLVGFYLPISYANIGTLSDTATWCYTFTYTGDDGGGGGGDDPKKGAVKATKSSGEILDASILSVADTGVSVHGNIIRSYYYVDDGGGGGGDDPIT